MVRLYGPSGTEIRNKKPQKRVSEEVKMISHTFAQERVTKIKCKNCKTEQAPNKFCSSCGIRFGSYFCRKCMIIDTDNKKRYFHCEGCGVCKEGGKENFFHCYTCKTCVSNELAHKHLHGEEEIDLEKCPVCELDLEDS